MNQKHIIILIFGLLTIPFTLAETQTQQYNQIYLSPYYVASIASGTNQQFNLNVTPPDGITRVLNAVLNFHSYILPTVTYTLTVNNKTCNTPTYTVSTTQASAGMADVSFDCSNIINKSGNYNIILTANKNTGATTATLDLTYMNNAKASVQVHGTEYVAGDPAKVWLQLLNSTKQAITNAVCYVDIYTPSGEEYVERAEMQNMQHDGIYYYDLIAPSIQGVYPTIATCYYEAISTSYSATNYEIQTGVYSAGTLTDTNIQDGNFLRIKEQNTRIRNISVILNYTNLDNCTTIPESLFTRIVLDQHIKFDSVLNDHITINIYNFTNNQWIPLPNKHLTSSAFTTTSNTIFINNLTKSGLYNKTRGGLILKLNDTQLTDATATNLDIDYTAVKCEQLGNSGFEQVKGSSEIHVGSGTNGLLFGVNTLCNLYDLSSSCGVFFQNTTILPDQQGLIMENITIYNNANIGNTEHLIYETGSTIDCSAIISITGIHTNYTLDKTTTATYSSGNGIDNCKITIPVELTVGEPEFQIQIIMDNYAKWEIQRTNDLLGVINTTLNNFCSAYNYTYEVPIINPLNTSDSLFVYCNRILDDIYSYDTLVRNDATTITTIGEYESYITEERFYYPQILQQYTSVQAINQAVIDSTNTNKINQILDLLQNQNNYTNQFNTTQNLINIQTQNIMTYIQSQVNLTTQDINALNTSIQNQLSILSNKINDENTNLTTLINQHTQSILNTLSQNYNLTTQQIITLNQTINTQYNDLLANQQITNNLLSQINTTNQYINQTLITQTTFLQIINQTLTMTDQKISQMNITIIQILNQTQVNEGWLQQIMNFLSGWLNTTLTGINNQVNNNSNKIDYLISLQLNETQTNLTAIPTFIVTNATNCITGANWKIDAQVLNQYGNIMTKPPITNCYINSTEFGYHAMTYNQTIFTYKTICPNPNSWNWTIECN